jgi:hypothetical protein
MSASCHATASRITESLGFSCHDANPVVTFRDPLHLENWTLPVLEALIVIGAVLALVHAIRRLRQGDPANLALWIASLVYLFVVEPPLYFPEWFGIERYTGFIFSHNVFSVQFMYDRLPLYIVAIYPAMSQLAYEVVRRLGVFARRGPLAGAICTALVYQAFYEVFDQLGPQRQWWAWNPGNTFNHPMLASVPVNSIWIFASVTFGAMTYLVLRLVGVPTSQGRPPRGWSFAWRTVVAGVLSVTAMFVFSLPTAVFGRDHPNVTGQAIVLTVEIVLLWAVGLVILLRERRAGLPPGNATDSAFRFFPIAYLVVLAGLWVASLPAYFGASGGLTKAGTPIGSLPYVVPCFLLAAFTLVKPRAPARRNDAIVAAPVAPQHG